MAIQHRRGVFTRFDPSKLLPGEWAIVLSGDTNVSDGRAVYICFAAGTVKRMATYEDMAENIANVNQELVEQLTGQVSIATTRANTAAQACEDGEETRVAAESTRVSNERARVEAESSRASAETTRAIAESSRVSAEQTRVTDESARASAETARVDAESTRIANENARIDAEQLRTSAEQTRITNEQDRVSAEALRVTVEQGRVAAENGRVSAEEGRVAAETARVAEFAQMQQMADGWLIYHCSSGEYDSATKKPTISSPATNTLYCVPTGDAEDPWEEWRYDSASEDFEHVGTTCVNVTGIPTSTIDSVIAGTAETGTDVLQTTGLTYLVNKIKTWAQGVFAALTHYHAAGDITSGTLGVARGGTGKATNTANSVLVGNNASAIKNIASASGAFFATGSNAQPQFDTLPIAQGGTSATSAKAARQSLGIHADLTWGDLKETLTWGQLRDG